MIQIINPIYNYLLELQGDPAKAILIIGLILIGLALMFPIKKMNEWAKEHIVQILIGYALIVTAVEIATGFTNQF